MKIKQIATVILLVILNSFIFLSCKKAGESDLPSKEVPEKAAKKKIKTSRKGGDNLPSIREFYFAKAYINYTQPISSSKNDQSERVLFSYLLSKKEQLLKYILIETYTDGSWKSSYLISKDKIPATIDLYKIEIHQNEVIDYDRLIKNEKNYLVNGVKVEDNIYSLDDPISAVERIAPPGCSDFVCLDSWLITYVVGTGEIVWIEYDPICGPLLCDNAGSGGGGGAGGANPANPPSLPTIEEAENILDQSYGVETYHTQATTGFGGFIPQQGIVKKAKIISWDFFSMHVYGGATVNYTALFNAVLYKNTSIPNFPWKWESITYSRYSESQAYTLGGYPPCIDGDMNVNAACAISGDQLNTGVNLHYNLSIKITCLGGMKWKEFQNTLDANFAASTYANDNDI